MPNPVYGKPVDDAHVVEDMVFDVVGVTDEVVRLWLVVFRGVMVIAGAELTATAEVGA